MRGTMRGARGAATEAGASVPISAAGSIIRITYLDDTWRVSRGDEGVCDCGRCRLSRPWTAALVCGLGLLGSSLNPLPPPPISS